MIKWLKRLCAEDVDEKIEKAIEENKDVLKINFLQNIQKLEVKDGDIVVIRHPGRLPDLMRKNLSEVVQNKIKSLGHNINVICLEDNMEIGVLTKKYTGPPQRHILPNGSVEFSRGYRPLSGSPNAKPPSEE